MEIYGIQKLTLLDFPGRIASTVFLSNCNLRCPYCHNANIALNKKSTECQYQNSPELLQLLLSRKPLIKNVVISGGEPLITPDIIQFIKEIKGIGLSVKIDTNGCFPDTLEKILSENLADYVALDIKNSPEKYPETVGLEFFDLEPVKESVKILKKCKIPYEFRTTIVKELHEISDIIRIGQWLSGSSNYYLQKFEQSDNVPNQDLHSPSCTDIKKLQLTATQFFQNVKLRGI